MWILGRSVLTLSLDTANREINDKGIMAAVLVASHIDPFWARDDLNNDQRQAAAERVEEELAAFLADPGAKGVLDILILDRRAQTFLASASGNTRVNLEGEVSLPGDATSRVTIFKGKMRSGGKVMEARSYERVITLDERPVGRVRVFLSAEAIQKMNGELTSTVTMYVVAGMVLGIVVMVLVGGLLTRPVRILKRDMDIVACGELHHKSVIRTGDELEQLAVAFNHMTGALAEAQGKEASRKALERELSIATTIQTALLPDRIPQLPGFELFPHYASAKEVGGDYYDFIPLDDGRYAVVVADVSGKGIPGSLVMTMTRSLMRMAARITQDPLEILIRVNASLSRDMTRGMFVTLVMADLDPRVGTVRIVRAGHNPAYLFRRSQQDLVAIQPPGIALGMDTGEMFDKVLRVQELHLDDGDFLALYTDGIIEAMDPKGNEYTAERFASVLKANHQRSAREIVESVLTNLDKHTRGAEVSDDITLIILKRNRG